MTGSKLSICVHAPADRQSLVLAIEAAAKAICDHAAIDPRETSKLLLVAAARMTAAARAGKPLTEAIEQMAVQLGEAIVEADDLFGLARRH